MVYVTRDGTVAQDMPWGLSKVTTIFWGVMNLVFGFFQTLIPGWTDSNESRSTFRSSGAGWRRGGGGGGGGSGWFGGDSGGRRPGGGPGGNIRTLGSYDSSPSGPPCASGGCCGS